MHERVNSFKFYAQLVLPNDEAIHDVTVQEVLAFGNASPNNYVGCVMSICFFGSQIFV